MLVRVLVTWLTLNAALAAQGHPNDLRNFGIHGPVKSIRATRGVLDPETIIKRWYTPADVCAQCTFDRLGRTQSRDTGHDGKGNITGRVEIRRDEDGRSVENISYDNQGNQTSRATTINGPHGPIEVKNFAGGKLQATDTMEYDAEGRLLRSRRVEADGTITYERTVTYGNNLEEERFHSPNSSFHSVRKYTDSTEEWLDYDQSENLILQATFNGAQLTSWWMKPNSGIGLGFNIPDASSGQTVGYSSTADGALERTVYLHPDRNGNVEPYEVLHFNAAGVLVEDARISYQRDAYGNWIRREITVVDAEQGQVVVQRDTREITYW